jgi:hypothetical protein
MAIYFAFAAIACALPAFADESVAESPHKSLMRRKESHMDSGAIALTISDAGGIRGSRGAAESEATRGNQARRRELDQILSRAGGRFQEIIKSQSFLEADHEAFHTSIDNVGKLHSLKATTRMGAAHGNWETASVKSRSSAKSRREKQRHAAVNDVETPADEETEGKEEEEVQTYCKWENTTCLPNLDYAYGPMDDPMLFNAYADAQACWTKEVQAGCFGKGCAWRDGQCHYAVPNVTGHALVVQHMPSINCGWFAKLERPRKCQTYAIEDCPMEMEPCTKGIMYMHSHFGPEAYCEPKEICDADLQKANDFLCEEPLVDIYVKCFTEVNAAGHTGTARERKEVECVHKECPDYAAMLEFSYIAGKLCPRYDAEIESCERQSNCSYSEKAGKCIPDSSQMMLDRVPKNCKYYDLFQKVKKCSTTMQGLCTDSDCDWVESSPCTGNDTVPQFECDVKNNVMLKTIIDNTDDEHLLTFAQAVTAKDVCLSSLHEDSCKTATPMERGLSIEGAAWRPAVGALCTSLVIAGVSLASFL